MSCCVLAAGCDDFLVENPETSVSNTGVYNSLSSANAVLIGCYGQMQSQNCYSFNYLHVLSASSGMGVSIKQTDVNLTSMNVLPSDVNVSNVYNGTYKTIMVANDIIKGMNTSLLPESVEKNRIHGEAYFIRALSYFNLVRLFGKVSLITEPVTSYENAHVPRTDVDRVYKQILFDLQKAWELLPEKADRAEGYPYKYAAKALRAKVYLTLAGNDENSEYWQLCYDDALDVMKNGGYKLVTPYTNLFGSPNKNNEESIFEIQFSATASEGRMTETTFPVGHELMDKIPTQGKSWGKTRPNQIAFDQFDEKDPRREASFVYEKYVNIYQKGKNRNVWLYPSPASNADKNSVFKKGDSEYAAWKKYYDPMMTALSTNANFVYMRYADVLLMLAEAANELPEHQSEAHIYLNMVLDRAADANGNGMRDESESVPAAIEESVSKEELREIIFRERLKEFTGECDEWYTVRRRGESYLKKIMQEHNDKIDQIFPDGKLRTFVYKYNITDDNVKKNMLLPFPQDEITRNENISQEEQNFGY